MVVVEGVARTLNPHFNMWKAAEPVVKEWISKNMGPIGMAKDLGEGAQSLLMLARRTPEIARSFQRVQRGLDNMAQNGFHLDDETVNRFANAQAKQNRFSRYAIIIMAACMVVITYKLIF